MNTTNSTISPTAPRSERILGQIQWNTLTPRIGSYALLILIAFFYLGPLFMLVNTALKSNASFNRNAISLATEFRVENFAEAWERANFAQYLLNSVYYTTLSTAIFVITAVFVAFPIARGYVKYANGFLILYVIALFLPPALIPQFQLILNLGLYNNPIGYIMLFLVNPIGTIILVNYIKTIPRELDEAAAIDGCGYFQFVLNVILPLIRPALATVIVMHAIGVWNDIITATIYLTGKQLYPITRGLIVFQGVYGSEWPLLAAAVLMLAFPMLILFLFLQRYIVSGLTAGSVKG